MSEYPSRICACGRGVILCGFVMTAMTGCASDSDNKARREAAFQNVDTQPSRSGQDYRDSFQTPASTDPHRSGDPR